MTFKRIGIMAALVMFMAVGLGVTFPATVQAQAQSATQGQKTMFCNTDNAELYKLCQDENFRNGLTPAQKKELDTEWQKRVPYMSPAERQLYYPEGRRYYTGS